MSSFSSGVEASERSSTLYGPDFTLSNRPISSMVADPPHETEDLAGMRDRAFFTASSPLST